jgi:hypothetical protein
MRLATSVLVLTVLLATSRLVVAGEPPALSHNPFSRPPSEVVRAEASIVEPGDGSAPAFPLQATMVGRINSLANVGGRILKPGDEYQGYRLLAVHERHVVFAKDGRNIDVYVKPERTEDDE